MGEDNLVGRGSRKSEAFCRRDSLVGAISFTRPKRVPSRGAGCVTTKSFHWSKAFIVSTPDRCEAQRPARRANWRGERQSGDTLYASG